MEDDAARLRCYDAAAGRAVPAEQEGAPAATPSAAAPVSPLTEEPSALARRWELEERARRERFALSPHLPNYFLPATYLTSPNDAVYRGTGSTSDLEHVEAKFQISFKVKLWNGVFGVPVSGWFAYTQLALWQLYNSKRSSPFRETDYQPELLLAVPVDYQLPGLRLRAFTIGLNHQSNGQGGLLSRSWNRVTAAALLEHGNLALTVQGWYRIPEDPADDDNPDIEDYVGRAQVVAAYKNGNQTYALTARDNLDFSTNRGSIQLDWTFPLLHNLKGYVQYFGGYGETLIDYNHVNHRIGFGVMLTDWL